MSQLRSLLRRLKNGGFVTLAEAVDHHIHSTGTGFELDDVMSGDRYPKEVVDGLYEIAAKYRTPEYPIGVSNPASFEELRLFAERYTEPNS
jgi:hypothetical protein